MAFCGNCGAETKEGVRFCPSCGADQNAQPGFNEKPANLNNPGNASGEFDAADIQNNKVQAVLAYLGILLLIPLFMAKESKFARFHVNQGLILWICSIAVSVLNGIFTGLDIGFASAILGLVSLATFILSIIGIVNAAQGQAKELPIIGNFRILKD